MQHDSGLVEAVGVWKYDNEHTNCYSNQVALNKAVLFTTLQHLYVLSLVTFRTGL